jgi:UDP-N-acetylglucosamine/UDP-N-acetylgalactosamine diphosphorylase
MQKKIHNLLLKLSKNAFSIKCIDKNDLKALQQELILSFSNSEKNLASFQYAKPLDAVEYYQKLYYFNEGTKLIKNGLVSSIILAGGEGSRLSTNKPKGCYEILKDKSLFELLFEKINKNQKDLNTPLFFGIMTSSKTHTYIINFLEKHRYFGLNKSQVLIFKQPDLPILSYPNKNLLVDENTLISSPNGNGGLLNALNNLNIINWFKKKNIQYLQTCFIDNPLSNPFDPYLVGFQSINQHDVVLKCFERIYEKEKVGLLLVNDKKIIIYDYCDIDYDVYINKKPSNQFYYNYANAGHYSFAFDFLSKNKNKKLQIHWVIKKTTQSKNTKKIYKGETFLFDVFKFAKSIGALNYPRDICYAPLKQKTGINGVQSVRKALALQTY